MLYYVHKVNQVSNKGVYNMYSFNELDEEAQAVAIGHHRDECEAQDDASVIAMFMEHDYKFYEDGNVVL